MLWRFSNARLLSVYNKTSEPCHGGMCTWINQNRKNARWRRVGNRMTLKFVYTYTGQDFIYWFDACRLIYLSTSIFIRTLEVWKYWWLYQLLKIGLLPLPFLVNNWNISTSFFQQVSFMKTLIRGGVLHVSPSRNLEKQIAWKAIDYRGVNRIIQLKSGSMPNLSTNLLLQVRWLRLELWECALVFGNFVTCG